MRLPTFMLALACATMPASAQQPDTRQTDYDISGWAGVATCGFAAYPDLMLEQGAAGTKGSAVWLMRASDSSDTEFAHLGILFTPMAGKPFGTIARAMPFSIDLPRPADRRMPRFGDEIPAPTPDNRSVRLLLDGHDSGVPLAHLPQYEDGTSLSFAMPREQGEALAARLMAARTAELVLRDAAGREIRRFHWDMPRTAGIPELLDRVSWDCFAPDPK